MSAWETTFSSLRLQKVTKNILEIAHFDSKILISRIFLHGQIHKTKLQIAITFNSLHFLPHPPDSYFRTNRFQLNQISGSYWWGATKSSFFFLSVRTVYFAALVNFYAKEPQSFYKSSHEKIVLFSRLFGRYPVWREIRSCCWHI